MKRICCMVLVLISFQVYGMKVFFLFDGGGGGCAVKFQYEEKLNALSDHEKTWRNCGPGLTIRAGAASFCAWEQLCENIEKVAHFADSENVNYYDGQGRTILHWVAEYGKDSDFNALIKIPGICPSFCDMRGKKPIDLVGQNKDSLKNALRSLENDHNQCEHCR